MILPIGCVHYIFAGFLFKVEALVLLEKIRFRILDIQIS